MTTCTTMPVLLEQLASELKRAALWQTESPDRSALQSQQPFAIDTLEPQQWLQWIFIPKMQALLEAKMRLPSGFEMSPYFEQVWANQSENQAVLNVIKKIDEVCA